MMARSTTRSNQRPDTLMQDRICQVDETSCNARPDHTWGSFETGSDDEQARLCPLCRRKRKLGVFRCELHSVVALSSLSAPRTTIFRASSGNGRCSAFASSRGAHPLARESLPSPNILV